MIIIYSNTIPGFPFLQAPLLIVTHNKLNSLTQEYKPVCQAGSKKGRVNKKQGEGGATKTQKKFP